MPPTILLLASGRGERFLASGGQVHKLAALLNGKKILDWTLDAVRASGLPYHLEQQGLPGMGDSIAAAVRATPNAEGWLILPADLPLIQASTLLKVAEQLQANQIVIPIFQGQKGHPVGFGAAYFQALSQLQGKAGAASLIAPHLVQKLEVADAGCVMDIDTVQDLQRVQEMAGIVRAF